MKPPSWDVFGNRPHFVCLRGFGVEDDKIVGYKEEIEKYTVTYDLGGVLWPSYPILFSENLDELADEIKKRGLFLFDIWGYVPGSGPGGYWQQYKPAPQALRILEEKLGHHWLGMDIGEQDGRYIGGYANHMFPMDPDRFENYLNFQRHFEHMGNELGNRLSVLVSLNFGHYLLKEGTYASIGAETAQALPNGQVYYAFIRGAGKQYGVPWFGNASVFNRWGYKTYGSTGPKNGPTKGTSLNLMKRLMYSHIFYNCVFSGFENGWFDGDSLSPIGRIQQGAKRWVEKEGPPGVMITPVAVMADFYAGWTFPRHLYTDKVYRVWGNLPYGAGDHLTDGVLDTVYPGYQDASYFHDESGFIAPTPYGDMVDCLLSDAPLWLLRRYSGLIVAGELTCSAELRDKLTAYVEGGGHLAITSSNLSQFPDGLAEVKVKEGLLSFGPRKCKKHGEKVPFELMKLNLPKGAKILKRIAGQPAVVEMACGQGRVLVFASPLGVPSSRTLEGAVQSMTDQPLPKPYPLLKHVREALEQFLRSHALFEVSEGLSLVTCRRGPGDYRLLVSNNGLAPKPLEILSHCGPVESRTEIPLDQSEKGALGYLPEGFEEAALGESTEGTIAGGDVRVFRVQVRETGIEEIPHEPPPAPAKGRFLTLRGNRPIQQEILLRPTFFEHFDGVVTDWNYLRTRSPDQLGRESGWIARQGVRVCVDLTSGINLYPDLRLVDNDPLEYEESMTAIHDVLTKMPLMGARDLILSLHRTPENNISHEETLNSFCQTLKRICAKAERETIVVHLRLTPKRPVTMAEAEEFLSRVQASNLRIAPSIGLLTHQRVKPGEAEIAEELVSLWLLSGPEADEDGKLWSVNAPAAGRVAQDAVKDWFHLAPGAAVVLDGVYRDQDEEFADLQLLP